MSKLFLGGLPTGPDVKRLHEAFSVPTEGQEITHEEIETILGVTRESSRYRTVTSAWRRELWKDDAIEVASMPGVGFRCLTPAERVDANVKKFQYGTRQQGRGFNRLRAVKADTLDHVHKVKHEHALRLGAAVLNAGVEMNKALQPPKPQAQITQMRTTPEPAATQEPKSKTN